MSRLAVAGRRWWGSVPVAATPGLRDPTVGTQLALWVNRSVASPRTLTSQASLRDAVIRRSRRLAELRTWDLRAVVTGSSRLEDLSSPLIVLDMCSAVVEFDYVRA